MNRTWLISCAKAAIWVNIVGLGLALPATGMAKAYDYLLNALANNDQYQATLTNVEIREKGINIAVAARRPQVRGNASYQLNNIPSPQGGNQPRDRDNVELRVTQQLFDPGSKAEVTVTENQLELARRQAQLMRQQILLATYQAYLQASLAQESLNLLDRRRDNLEEQLKVANSRYEVGEATLLPILNVKAALANLQADRLTATNDLAAALDNLEHLTGISSIPIRQLIHSPLQPRQLLAFWLEEAINSPGVRINATEIEIQNAVISQLNATVIPIISATGTSDFKGEERVAVEMSVPIFSSGGATAAIDRAKLQIKALEQSRASLLGETQLSISSAWRNFNVQELRREALTASIEAERQRLDLALASVELEAGVLVDAFDAASTLAQAELQLAQARHSQLIAWLELLAATGNLDLIQLERLESLFG